MKYVNFTIKDYLNKREYTINQDYGGFFKKQGWGVYDEKDMNKCGLSSNFFLMKQKSNRK